LLSALFAAGVAVSLGGCAIIEAEKNNRGGFLDEIADVHWMKADSKKMRALRAVALEASLGRIAMIAPKNASDRALLARRIGETTKRAEIVRQCAFGELQLAGQLASEPCFFFDSVMVDYENALFDLAMIALPIEEAKTLITRVSGGIASATINPLVLVQSLLDIGREAFRYGRVVGAIYRDTLELEVQVWLASPGLADRVGGLAAVYAQGNDNIPAWRAEIAALRAEGLEPIPQPRFILQLYGIIGYICGQIIPANPTDSDYVACARPDLTKLPALTVAGTSGLVISGIGAGGRSSSSGGAASGNSGANERLQNKINEQIGTINNLKAAKETAQRVALRGALTATERDMAPGTLLQIKKALCVKGPDLEVDAFDAQTRERLREFVGGLSWDLVNRNGAPNFNPSLSGPLTRATQSFPTCGDPLRNAYEVGVFTRNAADADLTISRAVDKLITAPRPTERRAMILALRKQAEPQNPSTTNDTLDDELWKKFIMLHGQFVAPPPPQPVAPNQQKKNP
jgi:hypothetical protein